MRTALLLSCLAVFALAQTAPVPDCRIGGQVVDHLTGRPLNHALVQLLRVGKGGGDASVLTGEDGRFAFLHLPQGKYQLTAQKRGQPPQGFHADGGYSTAIVVDGRQNTDAIVFALRTDASIHGVVMADDAEPVHNAQVILFRQSVNDGETQTLQRGSVPTNSSGQFHFGHLDAGGYYLAVQATPWFSQMSSQMGIAAELAYPLTFYGDTTDVAAARVVNLAEGSLVNVQINLRAAPGIRVKLPNAQRGIGLFVPGPGGAPIPVPTSSAVSKDGSTELINLVAGRYEVMLFGRPGESAGGMESVDLANGATLNLNQDAPGVSVLGRVLFDGARPNGELKVFLGNGRQRAMSADVSAGGNFHFENVRPGDYAIHMNSPGALIGSIRAAGGRFVHDHLQVVSGSSVNMTIQAVVAANLIKLDGFALRNGEGVPGAMVLLLPKDPANSRLIRRDQADSDGSFSLARVVPGRYTLVAIDDGRDLAYRNEVLMRPYLANGLAVTVPLSSNEGLRVPTQARRP